MDKPESNYNQIIEKIFFSHYKTGKKRFDFSRKEIIATANALKLTVPKNLGDVVYSYRYRKSLPEKIRKTTPKGMEWIIEGTAKGEYCFRLTKQFNASPNEQLVETKILDSTPGIINRYALSDEQALLAKIRYNRLIDIFMGLTCYSLQNHLRTSLENNVQAEVDEIYVGVDKRGAHFVLPVQAKGGRDRIGSVQILQDFAICSEKFPDATCKSIGAQFMDDNLIALFEFQIEDGDIKIAGEKHYRLVNQEELTPEELAKYRDRTE